MHVIAFSNYNCKHIVVGVDVSKYLNAKQLVNFNSLIRTYLGLGFPHSRKMRLQPEHWAYLCLCLPRLLIRVLEDLLKVAQKCEVTLCLCVRAG